MSIRLHFVILRDRFRLYLILQNAVEFGCRFMASA
jgi:hypothetical protein